LRLALAGASVLAFAAAGAARAADAGAPISTASASTATAATADAVAEIQAQPAPAATSTMPDFGKGFLERFINYQAWELGKMGPPDDPSAPPSRRPDFPPQPQTTPPMPFSEWPHGATTPIGVTRPNSVDSPLMVALQPSAIGKALNDAHVQVYGWGDVGGNLSTSTRKGGNSPAGYDYYPNKVQLDQAVLYVERLPDTVQQDHIDWGFRVSGIYGENYRYTTSYGLWSYQLLKNNKFEGYDMPMVYGEVYIPKVAQGMVIRFGRYISIPDIEAQLAPNNYMYTHSLGYNLDNYTNTGVVASVQVTKNLLVQSGVVLGTDTFFANYGKKIVNPYPNPLYPGKTFLKDPGNKPSFVGCLRYQTSDANNNLYLCADGINSGNYGYNNLQWLGGTFYHRFNAKWHISVEAFDLHENNVPNLLNPQVLAIVANGGTPFTAPGSSIRFNAPNMAICHDASALTCTTHARTLLSYLNYHFLPLDNLSLRTEYYDDSQGQRTGVAARYVDIGLGLQHWLSPQIELRPEVTYYHASSPAFNGDGADGIAPNKKDQTVLSGDVIVHF
jgi:hypothetical protein